MIIIALNLYKQILFNAVQPTSTANLPTTMSSPTAPIALTMAYTLSQESAYTSSLHVLTVQPTPTITPKPNASFKTLSGSYDSEMLLSVSKLYIKLSIINFFYLLLTETQKVIIITTGLTVMALLLITAFVAVMLRRYDCINKCFKHTM